MPISRAARLERVAAMHEVLGEEDAEIATDRAGRRLAGVRHAHHARTTSQVSSGPSTTIATTGPRLMNATSRRRSPCRRAPRSAGRAWRRRACAGRGPRSRPLASKRPTISPTSPRSTASGLSRTRCDQTWGRGYRRARSRSATCGGAKRFRSRGGRRRRRTASRSTSTASSPSATPAPIGRPLDGVADDHLVAPELGGAAAATPRPGMPRATGPCRRCTTSNSSARSASSIAVGSRAACRRRGSAGRRDRSRRRTPAAQTSAPAGLWAPSTIDQRLVAEHLEPAGHRDRRRTPRRPRRRRAGRRRTPRPRSGRPPRCRPGGRRAAARTRRGRSSSACGCRPAARRRRAGCRPSSKSTPRSSRWRRGGARSTSTSSGSVSPMTTADAGLMIPAFSRAMSASVGPANSLWSMPMLVTTATWASTTLVASHRPSRPTSTTATSTAVSANQRNAAAVHGLEVRRAHADRAPRGRRWRRSARRTSSSPIGSPLRRSAR